MAWTAWASLMPKQAACCMAANIITTVEANASCENGPFGCDTTGVLRTMAELE